MRIERGSRSGRGFFLPNLFRRSATEWCNVWLLAAVAAAPHFACESAGRPTDAGSSFEDGGRTDGFSEAAPDSGEVADPDGEMIEGGADEGGDVSSPDGSVDARTELVWRELARQETTRLVSGGVWDGRLYAGTHLGGASAIYDYPPFREQQVFGGESVLDFCAFAGTLFSSHENGPRIYRLTGDSWELAHDHGSGWVYMFFLTVFRGSLWATGGTAEFVGLLESTDGSTYAERAVLPGWNWLPVVYRDLLYVVGHDGAAYSPEPASGYASPDGIRFDRVEALTGGPEYQCACVWRDELFLGTGGWTNDRGNDASARIYVFDGMNRTEVFATDRNGVTDLIAFRGRLYATVDSGWERPEGDSRLYESVDGTTWSIVRTFPDPELRHMETLGDDTLVVYGGRAGDYGVLYAGE
ncbi:MAG: hypothetical protein GYA57_19760 [Myxococcales bacterium]|nr:hypothetical protein [Myxococcales bacterium]